MHGKFPALQQNQRNSILFHETIPLNIKLAVKLKLIFAQTPTVPVTV
jgi:hypothetical protein